MSGDGADRVLDRLLGIGGALAGEFVRDRGDVVLGQLAAEEGEQRDVVDVGNAFRVAGAEPADDRTQDGGQWHRLSLACLAGGLLSGGLTWRRRGDPSGRP